MVLILIGSASWFIANPESCTNAWKMKKMDRLVMVLKGAINAADRAGLMMNVPEDRLDEVLALLPALATPTVSQLSDKGWVAVNTVIEESIVTDLFPLLSEAGARGIVEYPLNKIIE